MKLKKINTNKSLDYELLSKFSYNQRREETKRKKRIVHLYGYQKLLLQRLLIRLINIKIRNLPFNNKHQLEFFKDEHK
ncbi:unnamed protein product [Rhizophagus irregularis]|nr:unnamed protein product [Rhizophagus irregularis]